MLSRQTVKPVPGYAFQSSRPFPKEPETVVIGQTDCDAAVLHDGHKACGHDNMTIHTIDGAKCYRFKIGKKYIFQLCHMVQHYRLSFDRFEESDIREHGSWDGRIDADASGMVYRPLWYHERGLTQTASGYGSKLVTRHMLWLEGRLYRVYCCLWSNSGTSYIIYKKRKIVVR